MQLLDSDIPELGMTEDRLLGRDYTPWFGPGFCGMGTVMCRQEY